MKVIVLYHPESDHARSVLTFERDFKIRTNQDVELVSVETVEGADMATTYDVTQYPTVMVTTNTGELIQLWQGEELPLINEVAGYIVIT
jgi:hypothetical protein